MEIDFEMVKAEFLAESQEHLNQIEQALLGLEQRPDDRELLTTVFRMAHTLKGSASMIGFPSIAGFAHSLEDILDRLRAGDLTLDRELTTLMLDAVDALRKMIPDTLAGRDEPQPTHRALVAWLEKQGLTPTPAPSANPQPATDGETAGPLARVGDPTRRAGFDASTRSLRVNVRKLDRMLNLTGELVISHGRVGALLERGDASDLRTVQEAHEVASRLLLELQEQVMQMRMVQVGPSFRQHLRSVRDLAASLNKQARLLIEGEDVEVDTALIEHIRDPLTHMIRNALDHGIEPPEVRRAWGKDPCGTLTLSARHDGGYVVIQLHDDGAGLDRGKIAARARETGLASGDLPDPELFQLIFEPGFSTAERVTDVSGRGIGMHVVRRNVEALRGTVSIESEEGKGATLTLRLPLTLAIVQGFAVAAGEEIYVLPLHSVSECLDFPSEEHLYDGRGVMNLRGEPLPCLSLRWVFGVEGDHPPRQSVVVVQHESGRAGLVVDRLLGEQQTVIKPLAKIFQSLKGISGSSILGSGRVALILDVPGLLRDALKQDTNVGRSEDRL